MSCVLTEKNITVTKQTDEQEQTVSLTRGAVVVIEAVETESGKGIPGADFLVGSDTNAERRDLSSQTVFVDHPVTNAEGKLQAVIAAGDYQFVVNTIPAGYQPLRKTS